MKTNVKNRCVSDKGKLTYDIVEICEKDIPGYLSTMDIDKTFDLIP